MRRALAMVLLFGFWAGCGEAPTVRRSTAALKALRLSAEAPEGVTAGFNLDDRVSDQRDDRTCKKADFMDPRGVPGVDNQLATLLPLLDLFGEGALESLLQQAINDGRLMMLFELFHHEDGSVDFVMYQGEDKPLLGTDGRLLEDQTLALKEAPPLGGAEGLLPLEGAVFAEAGDMDLPVLVFNNIYTMELEGTRARLELDASGQLVGGQIGGGVPVRVLMDMIDTVSRETGVDLRLLIGSTIEETADLALDEAGRCQNVSMAVTFEATPAFVLRP